jgi:hypothetical protein
MGDNLIAHKNLRIHQNKLGLNPTQLPQLSIRKASQKKQFKDEHYQPDFHIFDYTRKSVYAFTKALPLSFFQYRTTASKMLVLYRHLSNLRDLQYLRLLKSTIHYRTKN